MHLSPVKQPGVPAKTFRNARCGNQQHLLSASLCRSRAQNVSVHRLSGEMPTTFALRTEPVRAPPDRNTQQDSSGYIGRVTLDAISIRIETLPGAVVSAIHGILCRNVAFLSENAARDPDCRSCSFPPEQLN